jgi:hypothetical protein
MPRTVRGSAAGCRHQRREVESGSSCCRNVESLIPGQGRGVRYEASRLMTRRGSTRPVHRVSPFDPKQSSGVARYGR